MSITKISGNSPRTPELFVVTITTPNTEYSQSIPDGTKKICVNIRGGISSAITFRLAFETGKVATPVEPYISFASTGTWTIEGINSNGLTLYIASNTAGPYTAQIETWR